MSWGEFKAASNEVGNWIWGTVAGGFNEKQTIGQILVDAVISMIPVAGEVTAVRDVIAATIRLAEYPEKREESIEWVKLILPLLAIIPLLGGALKGIGKLILRAGKNAEEDAKILTACVWLLNKIGEGNALKFIRELDFVKYAKPIKEGVNELISRIKTCIDLVIEKFGNALPVKAQQHMQRLKTALDQVAKLVDKMVPQALKDLNNQLRFIQKLAYQGEWHLIPGTGKALARETEARLVHDVLLGKEVWKLENARWPQNAEGVFVPKTGWPNLREKTVVTKLTNKNDLVEYNIIAAFSGPIAAKELAPGTHLYRVVSPDDWSRAEGAWWTAIDPKTIKGAYWRVKFAVCQTWSSNGKYVKYVVKDKPLHAWEGKVSSQIDQASKLRNGQPNAAFGQYLEGGETQLYIDFTHVSNQHALTEVKALPKVDTNWTDHLNINIPERGASVQKLGQFVEEQKTLASANLASAANQSQHAVRATDDKQ